MEPTSIDIQEIYLAATFVLTYIWGELSKKGLPKINFWIKMASGLIAALVFAAFQGFDELISVAMGYISMIATHTSVINPLENAYKEKKTGLKTVKMKVPVDKNEVTLEEFKELLKNTGSSDIKIAVKD